MNSIFFCWLVLFSWYKVHHIANFIVRLAFLASMDRRYFISVPADLFNVYSFVGDQEYCRRFKDLF